jgi:2'-5' RNA ligase
MPHITLISPFRPVAEFDSLSRSFSRVCEGLEAFDLSLGTFHLFKHAGTNCTIWLAPEPRESVVRLQEALWQQVRDCDEVRNFPQGFVPHLSVGQTRGGHRATRLIADLQRGWTPLRLKVSQVSLIWRNDPPDDVFRIGSRVRLGPG